LFSGQHLLRQVERQFHPRRLGRRAPGIAGGERDAGQGRCGDGQAKEQWRGARRDRRPGRGQRPKAHTDQGRRRQAADQKGVAAAQAGRSQGHRRDQQEAEGVQDPAGQDEDRRHLGDVEAELQRQRPFAGRAPGRDGQGKQKVDASGRADDAKRGRQGPAQAEPERGRQHCGQLRAQGQPAQADQDARAQTPVRRQGVVEQPVDLPGEGERPIERGRP
jgi:hypothetical protein